MLLGHFWVVWFSAEPWFVRRLAKVLCSNVHHSDLTLFKPMIAKIEQRALVCWEQHFQVDDSHPHRILGLILLPSKHRIFQSPLGIPKDPADLLKHSCFHDLISLWLSVQVGFAHFLFFVSAQIHCLLSSQCLVQNQGVIH